MKTNPISDNRLQNQLVSGSDFKNIQEIVSWMGAMQAQDFNMAKWAVGIRLPGSTYQLVEQAINEGKIIRTHLLRPTWHIVSSNDIYWMLELTAPHLKRLLRGRHKQLELTETIINKSKSIIEKALTSGNHLTREDLMLHLENAHIATSGQRAAHLMLACELDGIVCNGVQKEKKQTYALLEERVQKPPSMKRDEALAKLASRYFTSHGPATIHDFIWWSGLGIRDARKALEMIKQDFISIESNQQTYWLSGSSAKTKNSVQSAYLIPAYDEFIISYKDRSPSILEENHKKAISDNGLFRPIIVINGQVAGTWKRIQKKDKVEIETDYFQSHDQFPNDLLTNASERYGQFLNRKTEIVCRSTDVILNTPNVG